ncbi:hypothetical protein [Paenibacillus pinistramenti]|uniref:hypothetical protein n=1 Tax=Paenibacillus pinistramenti TaxID=1768003 RepID=UPI001107AD2F|nr:hypothetical protein [Paenibacillus pinistramenti]
MNPVSMHKKFRFILVISLFVLTLTACSNYEWDGRSQSWDASFSYSSDNKTASYTIKYIGEEASITGFSYQFSGNVLTAFGGEEKKLQSPFQIKQKLSGKDYSKENSSVNLTIKWNGKEERLTLNKQ